MHEYIDYCGNDFVANGIKNETLKIICDKFDLFLSQANSSVEISMLFYHLMQLMLKLLNNKFIDKSKIKYIMIQLQQQLQSLYYDKCIKLMHTIGSSVSISNDEIEKFNRLILDYTGRMALYCFPINKENLIDLMSMHSQSPLSFFCKSLNITKTYPTENHKTLERHDVDVAFVQIIRDITNEKGYKFLNYIEPEELFNEIYNDFIHNTQMYMSMFNREGELYKKIKDRLPEYSLIDYNGVVCLAHLTQLFPILENKIRGFGACCNIVPFKEKFDEFLHMKDASSVLQQILMDVYSETKDFFNVVDLFFIYQCMYNGNCLNIRNECSHGREYISSDSLLFGFKTTLVCLKIILDRLNQIKSSEHKE